MKFGIHILPTYMPDVEGALPDFYQQMYDQIVEVEKLGFEQAWVTEHHFGGYGGTLPHPPTFLAAVAGKTTKIRLGVAVAVLPLHNPLQLAEAYAMADVISGGRLDFGIGKGSEPVEYRKFGMNRDEATQRFTECTEIIRQAWSDGPVKFPRRVLQLRRRRHSAKTAAAAASAHLGRRDAFGGDLSRRRRQRLRSDDGAVRPSDHRCPARLGADVP